MACIITILGNATDLFHGPSYLVNFNPDLPLDHPDLIHISLNKKDARQFADAREALAYWRTTHRSIPKRLDGKPNRPLTAFSIEIEHV